MLGCRDRCNLNGMCDSVAIEPRRGAAVGGSGSWRLERAHMTRQLPPRRWSLPSIVSILLGIGSVFSVIVGLLSMRPSFLLFGIAALAGPSFAAIGVGWALDFRLGITEGRWRIRAMHWFFNTVAGVCLGLAVVDAGR